jgi:hypothetical protein
LPVLILLLFFVDAPAPPLPPLPPLAFAISPLQVDAPAHDVRELLLLIVVVATVIGASFVVACHWIRIDGLVEHAAPTRTISDYFGRIVLPFGEPEGPYSCSATQKAAYDCREVMKQLIQAASPSPRRLPRTSCTGAKWLVFAIGECSAIDTGKGTGE